MNLNLNQRRARIRKLSKSKIKQKKLGKVKAYESEILSLKERCEDPNLLKKDITTFSDLPLSEATQNGLKENKYIEPTKIQRRSLPHGLFGKDILGGAKTGSGKTLAFIIPVLEKLYRLKWNHMDGIGALIITPTRELAFQIFNVLKTVGKHHKFSAGLLIGGHDSEAEKGVAGKVNILVATPGRLLAHMDETFGFNCDNLQILVLDEADRCLDEGFETTLNEIINNIPRKRQTLLFSATQEKSVSALAQLSLNNYECILVSLDDNHSTPDNLIQKYLVCRIEEKLNILYSFLKAHIKSKIIVFVSTCKQVRFIHEVFCKLRPGIIISCLYGKQKQSKRLRIFEEFTRKSAICLICTDIAARGLDFPAVNWIVQLDCPDSISTYIHRVGRTARYESKGEALLLLLPSEEQVMVEKIKERRIPIKRTKISSSRIVSIQSHLQAFCTQFPELKHLALKAFVSYVRSVHLQKDKSIFKLDRIDHPKFAECLGLINVPKIRLLNSQKDEKNSSRKFRALEAQCKGEQKEKKKETKFKSLEKKFSKKNVTVFSKSYRDLVDHEGGEWQEGDNKDPNDEILVLKRKYDDTDIPDPVLEGRREPLKPREVLKNRRKEILSRGMGKHILFNEDGLPEEKFKFKDLNSFIEEKPLEKRSQEYLKSNLIRMQQEDEIDKKASRELLREKRASKKSKLNR